MHTLHARFRTHTALAGALAAVLLASCATQPTATSFPTPQTGDDGVVIAESAMVPGVTQADSIAAGPDDCEGPGLGVTVQGTLSDNRFLFDKNGEPCEAAETLFDGRQPIFNRQADPSVALQVHDSLGPVPEGELPPLKPIPEVKLSSEMLPEDAAMAAANAKARGDDNTLTTKLGPQLGNKAAAVPVAQATAGPDPLMATLSAWGRQDAVYANRSAEADEAATREIAHLTKGIKDSSGEESMAKLMATLRERERQVQEEQRRHMETLERAQENRQMTVAAKEQWQQKEQDLEGNLKATQARLAQYEELSQRLAAEQASKDKAYQQQITTLNADLKAAEIQADASRRSLVLQAAAKIAEAEQLANAAKLQEQDIKLREAARLKAEAETMMDRALAIKAGQSVTFQGAPPAVPLQLMQTPVVLHASNQTLPDIMATLLKQAAPQAGEWTTDWQLSSTALPILKEKWSLTAEAPVQQVIAQLKQQVKEAYGLDLVFTQFPQSRLLVVTDATPASPEAPGTGK